MYIIKLLISKPIPIFKSAVSWLPSKPPFSLQRRPPNSHTPAPPPASSASCSASDGLAHAISHRPTQQRIPSLTRRLPRPLKKQPAPASRTYGHRPTPVALFRFGVSSLDLTVVSFSRICQSISVFNRSEPKFSVSVRLRFVTVIFRLIRFFYFG